MSEPPITREQLRDVTEAWWLLVVLGVIGVVPGVLVVAKPSHPLPAS